MNNQPTDQSFLHKFELHFEDGTKKLVNVTSNKPSIDAKSTPGLDQHWEQLYDSKVVYARLVSCRAIVLPSETSKSPRLSENASASQGEPPAFAEFLCACFAPKKHRDGILGDLATDYRRHLTEGSAARAKRLYWGGVLATMWPLLRRWVSRMAWSSVGASILKWWSS